MRNPATFKSVCTGVLLLLGNWAQATDVLTPIPPQYNKMESQARDKALKRSLLRLDIMALVHELFETPTLDAFVASDNFHIGALCRVAVDWRYETRGRLAALIILLKSDEAGYASIAPADKARTFCDALSENVLLDDEAWGALWWSEDEGLLGRQIVQQQEAAIPHLVPLLNETSLRNRFKGGERAALLEIRAYRVKDFAAYYIARIKGYDLPWQQDLAERDAAIAAMRLALGC